MSPGELVVSHGFVAAAILCVLQGYESVDGGKKSGDSRKILP